MRWKHLGRRRQPRRSATMTTKPSTSSRTMATSSGMRLSSRHRLRLKPPSPYRSNPERLGSVEGAGMRLSKQDAEREAIRRWYQLPAEARQTQDDATNY